MNKFLSKLSIAIATLISSCAESDRIAAVSNKQEAARYPMEISEFLSRMNSVLLSSCDSAREEYNLSRAECLKVIKSRIESCAGRISKPTDIADSIEFKDYGRWYLECGKPYYYCNGTEVRTIPSAYLHCK
jgi:hypothetical protein